MKFHHAATVNKSTAPRSKERSTLKTLRPSDRLRLGETSARPEGSIREERRKICRAALSLSEILSGVPCCATCAGGAAQGGAGVAVELLHLPPSPFRGRWVERRTKSGSNTGGAKSVIGGRPDFDEGSFLALSVQAFDDNEHAVLDPCLEQGGDLRAVRLIRRVELQDGGDGITRPILGL